VTRSWRKVASSWGGSGLAGTKFLALASTSAALEDASTVPASKKPLLEIKARLLVPVFDSLFCFTAFSF
jgi:hypothetical protein